MSNKAQYNSALEAAYAAFAAELKSKAAESSKGNAAVARELRAQARREMRSSKAYGIHAVKAAEAAKYVRPALGQY